MWFQAPQGYKVGYSKFIAPIPAPFPVGNAELKSTGEPALLLEEVAFSVYYPAKHPNNSVSGAEWLTRPTRASYEGYTHFSGLSKWLVWPLVYIFGARLRMPFYLDAPLQRVESPKQNGWPLVIFSHGLGGSCTAYSQVCSALAASGKVVLAIEHRDGTAHACPVSLTSGGMKSGKGKLYLTEAEVKWESEVANEPLKFRLRAEQLLFRRHEVYLAYEAFSNFVQGKKTLLSTEGAEVPHGEWLNAVEHTQDVALVGHSFGGATTLSILANESLLDTNTRIPVTKAVILDPWLEPLPSPGPSPYNHDTLQEHPRLLTINSEGFTLWKPHFERLKEVVGSWGPGGNDILTIVKSRHISFSDFQVLPYVGSRLAHDIMNTITDLTNAFLDKEDYKSELQLAVKPLQFEDTGMKKKDGSAQLRIVGEPGSVVS